jgi:hypothetical protein
MARGARRMREITDSACCFYLVLGLGDTSIARRLVRLLLADPLKPREAWEDLLDSYITDGSHGILLR